MISINEKFEEFMEQVKAFNFSYVLTTDLDEWKKNINKEYLIKKELKEVIDELGIESVPRLHKVVIEAVDHVLLNDLETKIIDNDPSTRINSMLTDNYRCVLGRSVWWVSTNHSDNHQARHRI